MNLIPSPDLLTLAAVGSSPTADGASASALTLTLQPADGTHPGSLTAGAQTIGGIKTFVGGSISPGAATRSITLNSPNENDGFKVIVPDGTANNAQYVLSCGTENADGEAAVFQLNSPSSTVDPNATFVLNRLNGPLWFGTNNLERARILAGGTFLVGRSTDDGSGALFQVAGAIHGSSTITAAGNLSGANLSGTNTGDLTIGTANGLSRSGQVLSLALATTGAAGAMSAADKVTIGNQSGTNSGDVTLGTASGLSLSGQALSLQLATDSVPGAMSAADHAALTSLVGGSGGISQLTGDVTAGPGSGSQAATIANSAVTNAKLANMASMKVKANITGSAAAPTDVTVSADSAFINSFAFRNTYGNTVFNNIIGGFATTATAAGTTTLVVSSAQIQQFTGTTTQNVALPDATTLPQAGFSFRIVNRSTGVVTVKDNGGSTVLAVPAGASVLFICSDVSTSNGIWDAGGLQAPTTSSLGGVNSHASTSHQFLTQIGTDGSISAAQPAFTDISGSVAASQLPNPSSSSLGGIQSIAAVSHKFLTSISTSGVPALAQPVPSDLTGWPANAAGVLTNDGSGVLTWGAGGSGITALTGDVTASGTGSVAAAVALVGGSTAANVHAAELLANAATSTVTASTIAKWDSHSNLSANNLIDGWATTVSAGGSSTLTVSSAGVQQVTGTTTHTFVLPDATTLVLGFAVTFKNRSTSNVTINKNGGSLAFTLLPNADIMLTVTAIGTAAGTWDTAALPAPTTTTLGGVKSLARPTNQYLTQISTDGSVSAAQPNFNELSGSLAAGQLPAGVSLASSQWVFTGNSSTATKTGGYALTVLGAANDGIKIMAQDGTTNNAQLVFSAGSEPAANQGMLLQLNAHSSSSDPDAFFIYNHCNGPLIFATNGTERYRVLAGGAFLVGTTTSQGSGATFQVVGTQYVSSRLYIGSSTDDGSHALQVTGTGTVSGTLTASASSQAINASNGYIESKSGLYNHGWVQNDSRHAVADADYNNSTFFYVVAYTSITAARQVTLPAISDGIECLVLDESGSCSGVNTITVKPVSGTVSGGNVVINTAYGFARFRCNSTAWYKIG